MSDTTHPAATAAPVDVPGAEEMLGVDALAFLAELDRRFESRRQELLTARATREPVLGPLAETEDIRTARWQVAAPARDYVDRRVEITGPPERKMVINALNAGARGFMADFEDATSPTWANVVAGQVNLRDAVDGTISVEADGEVRRLAPRHAKLLVRPRGWHLPERHVTVDDRPMSGSLVDAGLYLFHCAPRLHRKGRSVQLYLPKLEHHLEARLWNDVLTFVEDALELPRGLIRATVLIETLPAVFQMEEILWELRAHSGGLNAGRWDYIFSAIKVLRDLPDCVLPDRAHVTMTAPFMRAYTELLVQTCHRRGAFAMGGMAALVPSRRDPAASERALAAVREDKRREAQAGFDGTWVAHPDVVEAAMEQLDAVLTGPNQIDRLRDDVSVGPEQLLDLQATPGFITRAGIAGNVDVAFRYLSAWLAGRGAVAIHGLMEDAATAEIARTQLWQWIRHGARTEDGEVVTRELVAATIDEQVAAIRDEVGAEVFAAGRPAETRELLERLVLSDELAEFLTLDAYAALG